MTDFGNVPALIEFSCYNDTRWFYSERCYSRQVYNKITSPGSSETVHSVSACVNVGSYADHPVCFVAMYSRLALVLVYFSTFSCVLCLFECRVVYYVENNILASATPPTVVEKCHLL